MKVYQEIANVLTALRYCEASDSKSHLQAMIPKHKTVLHAMVDEKMPSGSGVDTGTVIVINECTPQKLVFKFSFHHMDQGGTYCGWTDHIAVVRPCLASGFSLTITGRNRNNIKEYLHDVFHSALNAEYVTENRATLAKA